MSQDPSLNPTASAGRSGGTSETNHAEAGGKTPTSRDSVLELALAENSALAAELKALREKNPAAPNNDLAGLAVLLKELMTPKPTAPAPDSNNRVNSTATLKDQASKVDGEGLMRAQATLLAFKNEPTEPISIPRSMKDHVGPALAVTVNGVRVSIPCDGQTYFINRTHALHAKERLAKIDIMNMNTDADIQTIK